MLPLIANWFVECEAVTICSILWYVVTVAVALSHGPQLANGGKATLASHGLQMANGGCKSSTDSCDSKSRPKDVELTGFLPWPRAAREV